MELCDPSAIAAAYMHISDRALCMLHPDWVNSPLDKKVLTSHSNPAPPIALSFVRLTDQ